MNLVEINKLFEVQEILNNVLDGKVHLKELKKAKKILDDVMEFKDIDSAQLWKFTLDD